MLCQSNPTEFGAFDHLKFVFSREMPICTPRKHNCADKLVVFPNTKAGCLGAGEGSAVMPMLHGVLCRLVAAPIDSESRLTGRIHDHILDRESDSFCRAVPDRRLKWARNPAPSSTLL